MLLQLALKALDQMHRAAPRSHLRPLLETGLVLAPLGAVVAARLSRSVLAALLGALSGAALTVAISLTLFRGGFGHASLARLRTCALTDPTLLSGDGLANLALFAPAAFFAVLAIGRPLGVAAGVAVVSVAVEAVQAIEWVGICDSSDAVHNTLGGLVAALAAALLRSAFVGSRRLTTVSVPGSDPCPRSC